MSSSFEIEDPLEFIAFKRVRKQHEISLRGAALSGELSFFDLLIAQIYLLLRNSDSMESDGRAVSVASISLIDEFCHVH